MGALLLSSKAIAELARNYSGFKRNTIEGEYRALLIVCNASGQNIKLDLDFATFTQIVSQPCTFCGGTTPGYPCNTVSCKIKSRGFVKSNVYPSCWNCKRLVGLTPRRNFEQIVKIVDHCNKTFPLVFEE